MRKKIIQTIFIMMILSIIIPIKVNAGFQANKGGTSHKTSTRIGIYAIHLFTGIRQMESQGGTLGLSATLAETTYLEEGSGNGIDCHMVKNTEWGTAAMLSASQFGNAPIGESDDSTTGNSSGIYQMANKDGYELATGIYNASNNYMGAIKMADSRYYNLYMTNTTSASIAGDATTETFGWKGGNGDSLPNGNYPIICRNYRGIFGVYATNGSDQSNYGSNAFAASTRAVVVCGEGL